MNNLEKTIREEIKPALFVAMSIVCAFFLAKSFCDWRARVELFSNVKHECLK